MGQFLTGKGKNLLPVPVPCRNLRETILVTFINSLWALTPPPLVLHILAVFGSLSDGFR